MLEVFCFLMEKFFKMKILINTHNIIYLNNNQHLSPEK